MATRFTLLYNYVGPLLLNIIIINFIGCSIYRLENKKVYRKLLKLRRISFEEVKPNPRYKVIVYWDRSGHQEEKVKIE